MPIQIYSMTVKGHDIVGKWEPCKAKTLTGAKREATARFGGGFLGSQIIVGIERQPGLYQTLATKNIGRRKWLEWI